MGKDLCRLFWDGNETWLVLGGGGLFVAFPVAYAIILPAFYLPIILMLMGLIFRGIAFEFRFKADDHDRKLWDIAFHGGSLLAAFMQGMILGNFIQGIEVEGRAFAGGPLDWANHFVLYGILLLYFPREKQPRSDVLGFCLYMILTKRILGSYENASFMC